MAIKYFYIGGTGPYFYDDTVPVLDPDGNFGAMNQNALVTTGQLVVEGDPVDDDNVVRFSDLLTRIIETFVTTGTIATNTQVVYAIGTFDLFLPTLANGEKREYTIVNTSTGLITLKPNSTEPTVEINGETSQPLRQHNSITVISDNTKWSVL